ncbi:hypothetical protein N7468_003146 [Penicillium chermesinum]|uniref:Uncharacterized protein n=1 Tax=Penicillium chermesinum TaxID=63820 RepID=A0A9W9P8S2_9EURO|nr:uncharacterized protein N7468_003146 [Penicillium chermesinum]KAJ5238527.1 hypothetical protein N7468_003146 [Penicillium chermesinum]
MEASNFTFVNTTGASSLSQPAARRVRAHITKANFAKRRHQLSAAGLGEEPGKVRFAYSDQQKLHLKRRKNGPVSRPLEATWLMNGAPPSSADLQALHEIQDLCFLEGRHAPNSPSEAAWFHMIASEPALIEATMAVSVGLMSPGNWWQIKSGLHLSNAVSLIKDKIISTATRTDGVLAAVCTMAFSAALAQDTLAWKVHIDGVTHIIKDRNMRMSNPVFPWLTDIVTQDSVNYICGFPRFYHKQVIYALNGDKDTKFRKLVKICEDVIQLQNVVESHHTHSFDPNFVAREIEEPISSLIFQSRFLRAGDDANMDSAARAIELFLYLLWPSQSAAHLTLLAEQMKHSIIKWPVKGCMFMDLTCFQFVIGAVAAEKGSSTREWFVNKIAGAVRAMKQRGWLNPLHLMGNRYHSGIGVSMKFTALWEELDDMCAELKALEWGPHIDS